MKVEKINVTYGRTINLGNYESCRIEAGAEILLDAKESAKDMYAAAFLEVKEVVTERVKEMREKVKLKK